MNEFLRQSIIRTQGIDLAALERGRPRQMLLSVLYRLRTWWNLPSAVRRGKHVAVDSDCVFENPSRIKLEDGVCIRKSAWFSVCADAEVVLEEGVYLGRGFQLSATKSIRIGRYVMVSDRVFIGDGSHGYSNPDVPILLQPLESKGPVEIGQGCWIGVGAVILGGVKLGKNCVVAANAVVTHSFPDHSVIGGIPARSLR